MSEKQKSSKSNDFISELLEEISDQFHKRIIGAYQDNDPVFAMETELGKILLEVLNRHED
jgi:hypothetical protein